MKFTAHFSRTELTQIIADALKSQGFEMESLALFDEHSEHIEFAFASAPVTHIESDKNRVTICAVYEIRENKVTHFKSFTSMTIAEEAVKVYRELYPNSSFVIRSM